MGDVDPMKVDRPVCSCLWPITVWVTIVITVVSVIGCLAFRAIRANKEADFTEDYMRMSPVLTESGLTPGDPSLPSGAKPARVLAGVYVDRIEEVNLKDSRWLAYFYLWFEWRGGKVNPAVNFQIVNGDVLSKEKLADITFGRSHYQRYRLKVSMSKNFDTLRFPCEEHLLNIDVEDDELERHELIFVPDNQNSRVSSRIGIPGYRIYDTLAIEKPHTYKSTLGDPRVHREETSTHSQFRFGVWVSRPDSGFYFKLFFALFGSVLISFLCMFAPPRIDTRFAVQVAAFFSVVANLIYISSLVPGAGIFTMADMVTGIGIVFILLAMIEAVISGKLHENGHENQSRLFDRISFSLLFTAYATINIIIYGAAVF
jgi:hypothetical protein